MTPTDPHVPVSEVDDASTPQPHTIPSMVVAIGASAGGHEPLEQIFTRLTTDTGLAFVVLMHLIALKQALRAEELKPPRAGRTNFGAIHRAQHPAFQLQHCGEMIGKMDGMNAAGPGHHPHNLLAGNIA